MARHRPRRQHRGRDDRDRRASRLRRTLQNHRPHPRRGQGRQPRRLRHDPEALRHDRVGMIFLRIYYIQVPESQFKASGICFNNVNRDVCLIFIKE